MSGMLSLAACPACGHPEHSPIAPFNSLALIPELVGEDVTRYEYVLCHACGLVYASRRPDRDLFRTLTERFDENIGRSQAKSPTMTAEEREDMRRRVAHGWAPSEESELAGRDWWPGLWADRMSLAPYLTILASTLDLRGARVVEVRTVTGAMLESLRSWFGAEVYAMPAFERHRFVIEEAWGIPADGILDFHDFDIPYDGEFDLVLAKHMFTHAVDPGRFLDRVAARLRPGGHVFLYVENGDVQMHDRGKNLISELRCFHFQQFDLRTLARCLRSRGFEPVFLRNVDKSALGCIARLDPTVASKPMPEDELEARLDMYARWYDLSLLSLPESRLAAYADDLEPAAARALARGDATRDEHERLRPARVFGIQAGYFEDTKAEPAAARTPAPVQP